MNVPQGIAVEVGQEDAKKKHSKKHKWNVGDNSWVDFFRRFPRIPAQAPSVVETKGGGAKRDRRHEQDAVDVGHVVHDGLLQMADVVLSFVPQPVQVCILPEHLVFMQIMNHLNFSTILREAWKSVEVIRSV